MSSAEPLLAFAQAWFAIAGLVFLRVGAAMALLPGFGEQSLPLRVRLAAALAFTAVVAPAVAPGLPQLGGAALLQAVAAEVVIGLALGFGARLLLVALHFGGAMVAQATSLAQMAGASAPDPQPAIGQALTIAGLALAMAARLHVRIAALFILSYELLPAGRMPAAADLSRWSLSETSAALTLGFTIAAPFLIAALLFNTAMGVLNRAMPQLMVVFVGAPLLTFGALAMLVAVAPPALALWLRALTRFLADPFSVVP